MAATGKAAVAMFNGAYERLGGRIELALAITKHNHEAGLSVPVEILTGGHPFPDDASLAAGDRLIEFLAELPPEMPLLMLISGGSSSILEVPIAGVDGELLNRANRWLLGSGLAIDEVNAVRSALSSIKAGGLCAHVGDRPLEVLLMSDVKGDDASVIGSGLLSPRLLTLPEGLPDWLEQAVRRGIDSRPPMETAIDPRVIASLAMALDAAAAEARALGYTSRVHADFIEGDAAEVGRELVREVMASPPALHIWGGETTVALPDEPGRGGRNQHMALAMAEMMEDLDDCYFLAAGTDGSDGPTEDAGALVDGGTITRGRDGGFDERLCLIHCNSGAFLEASGDLIVTGPTGANVMDLMIGLRLDDPGQR